MCYNSIVVYYLHVEMCSHMWNPVQTRPSYPVSDIQFNDNEFFLKMHHIFPYGNKSTVRWKNTAG